MPIPGVSPLRIGGSQNTEGILARRRPDDKFAAWIFCSCTSDEQTFLGDLEHIGQDLL